MLHAVKFPINFIYRVNRFECLRCFWRYEKTLFTKIVWHRGSHSTAVIVILFVAGGELLSYLKVISTFFWYILFLSINRCNSKFSIKRCVNLCMYIHWKTISLDIYKIDFMSLLNERRNRILFEFYKVKLKISTETIIFRRT